MALWFVRLAWSRLHLPEPLAPLGRGSRSPRTPPSQVRITMTGAHYVPGLLQLARVGCLPSELQKHNASLMRQLASHAYLQVA